MSLDPNGGVVSPAQFTVTDYAPYGELPQPEKNYYLFDGLYTGRSEGERITVDSIVYYEMVQTLSAHWISPAMPSPCRPLDSPDSPKCDIFVTKQMILCIHQKTKHTGEFE